MCMILSPSLYIKVKVIATNIVREIIYDFTLVLHCTPVGKTCGTAATNCDELGYTAITAVFTAVTVNMLPYYGKKNDGNIIPWRRRGLEVGCTCAGRKILRCLSPILLCPATAGQSGAQSYSGNH